MTVSRRDLCLTLPALGVFAGLMSGLEAEAAGSSVLSRSMAFTFDQLPVTSSAGGLKTRPVLRGQLPTGEQVELHETTLLPGQMPHPPHKHRHTEFMLIREGMLEFTADGKPHTLGPGGVAYAASQEVHGLKNIGSVPANYFVIAIGAMSPAS